MRVVALVTGTEEVKYKDKTDGTPKSFFKVNFIDTENKAGTPQDVTLSKDPAELAKEVALFSASRLKVVSFNVFQIGKYSNFGGMVTA